MLEPVKDMLRRQSLKKNASTEPTGFVPLSKIRSAVAFIDVEDTSFNECKNTLLLFFREHNIKGDIFFFDFRKLTEGERLITSITTTILKKDLNWFGKPSRDRVQLPGNTFDLVFKDPEDRKLSEAEVCKELIKFMDKIR